MSDSLHMLVFLLPFVTELFKKLSVLHEFMSASANCTTMQTTVMGYLSFQQVVLSATYLVAWQMRPVLLIRYDEVPFSSTRGHCLPPTLLWSAVLRLQCWSLFSLPVWLNGEEWRIRAVPKWIQTPKKRKSLHNLNENQKKLDIAPHKSRRHTHTL